MALNMLPHVNAEVLSVLKNRGIVTGHDLLSSSADHVRGALRTVIGPPQVAEFLQVRQQFLILLVGHFGEIRMHQCFGICYLSSLFLNFSIGGHDKSVDWIAEALFTSSSLHIFV